jgi:hypothetical protein
MNLQIELEKLKDLYSSNTEDFEKHYLSMREMFPDEKQQIDDYIRLVISESLKKTDAFIKETNVKMQLMEITEIISLSYIAKNYFNKTRTWLYQKINGNKVNGKEASFTKEEISILNYAIQDISKKLGSTVISL